MRVFLLYILTMIGNAEPVRLVSEPRADLSLQLRFNGNLAPSLGPAARQAAPDKVTFEEEEGRYIACLPGPDRPRGPAPVIAAWNAQKVLRNSQGAVSFHVRIQSDEEDEKAKTMRSVLPVLALADTGGGTWELRVSETGELLIKKKQGPLPGEDGPPPDIDISAEDEGRPEGGSEAGALEAGELDTSDGKTPVGTFRCSSSAQLFAEGVASGAGGRTNVFKRRQWRHVVYTWCSVRHDFFVDGKLLRSWLLSRLQPIQSPEAELRLLGANLELADLRVYRRHLEQAEAIALGEAKPDEYLPVPPPMRVRVEWGISTGRSVVYADVGSLPARSVTLSCVDVGSGRVLKGKKVSHLPSSLAETVIPVTEPHPFPEGVYRYEAIAYGEDGKQLARAQSPDWTAEKLDLAWLGSKAGLKMTILPPYDPIKVEGTVIHTSLREHGIDQTGFFKSIVAGGEEVLDSPVRLAVLAGDKELSFSGGEPTVRPPGPDGYDAAWTATSTSPAGHMLRVEGGIEYDGMARFDVSLTPKAPLSVSRIQLRIPLKTEVCRFIHSIASGFIHRFMSVRRDEKGLWSAKHISWGTFADNKRVRAPGVVFDSYHVAHAPGVNRYHFTPFVHIGNFHRGLTWFAENDRGWRHDPGQVAPLEVSATDDEKTLRLNVVARPTELTQPLQFRFYLLANPYKPLPEDWRTWSIGDWRKATEFSRRSRYRWMWHWNEYAGSFRPYPGGTFGKTYEDWIGKFKGDDIKHAPFINYGVPSGSGIYGAPHFRESAVLPYSWKLHNHRPHGDYVCYWMDRCIREVGISGVYIDEPYGDPYSYNVLAGDAPYVREDGTRSVGYRWLEGREHFRRVRQTFLDQGHEHSIWLHTSSWKALPMMTFIDISMDGEWPAIWVKSFENYHIFYNREKSRAYLSGIPFGFVGSQMLNGNVNPRTFPAIWNCARTYLAVTLPYSVVPMSTNIAAELDRINNIRYAFGVYDPELEELTYDEREEWLPQASIEPEGLHVGGMTNLTKNQALLYAAAPWQKVKRYTVDGGFQGLPLGKPHRHVWNAENGISLLVDGKTVIDNRYNDLAVLLVRGADKPQPSRPDGLILGVSFDQSLDPDLGSGITAPSVVKNRPPLRTVPGKSGKAIAFGHQEGAVGYPVVPSWVQGTVEFDLRMDALSELPLRILQLSHHLDVTLSCYLDDGKPVLHLKTSEVTPGADLPYQSTTKLPFGTHTCAATPRVEELGRWGHVTVVWRSGTHDLYWNGARIGRAMTLAAPRLQDAAAMPCGVWVGPSPGKAPLTKDQIAVDSLKVYQWALTEADVTAYTKREPMTAAARPSETDSFPVRIWTKTGLKYSAGVFLANSKHGYAASSVQFSLFEKKRPKLALAKATLPLWLGTGVAELSPTGDQIGAADAMPDDLMAGDDDDDEEEADLGELGEEKEMVLKIEVYEGKKLLTTKSVQFKAGVEELENPTGEYLAQ